MNSSYAAEKKLRWKITNPTWTEDFELQYQNFIHTMGVARKNNACHTTDQCLRSNLANPLYAAKNPAGLQSIFSDCADLPYVLRAYFAWMNDLPFTFPTDLVEAKSFTRNKSDIRYSRYGNIITQKRIIRSGDNINSVLEDVVNSTSTASFRTNVTKYDSGNLFRDTYPTNINRNAITPGTIVYDPNGHVAVVYEITKTGQIHLIDAHPDNSLTTITYGEKFARTGVKTAGGFSNFRPFSYENGNVTPKRNSELPNFSLIQYQKDPYIYKGEIVSFYEYVRLVMADGDIIFNPVSELKDYMNELCLDIKYREDAVNIALKNKIDQQSHPYLLPANIYGSDGDWEAYATPARDARFKASLREVKKYLTKVFEGQIDRSIKINYQGDDLKTQLREVYLTITRSCSIHPTTNLTMNLDDVLQNILALSFDPYHCASLRWGIIGDQNCQSSTNKNKWYYAEQGLRNRVDRDYSIKTDFSVDDLPNAPASQVEKPDLSLDQLLEIPREN